MDKSRGTPLKKPLRIINDFRVRGKETPLQNMVREFIKTHPNCIIKDITDDKLFKTRDFASIRNVIRKMVESHSIIQRFSLN